MAYKVLIVESDTGISVKLNNLILRKEDGEIWYPLDDISTIVMDNLSTNISMRCLALLAENGIALITCDQQHLPIGYYSSYDNHSRASKVLKYQINADRDMFGEIWKQIVISKIQNQAIAYNYLKNDPEGMDRILEFSYEVLPDDVTNREAHAAKVYFNQLMGASFSRGNEDILLNSGLDYGYSILRSYIARCCVGYGLNTKIGIHHKSEYNRFNLVDDLMEPFRPTVDILASKLLEDSDYFLPMHRKGLINILNTKLKYHKKDMYLCNALEIYVGQFASVIMGRRDTIEFPDVTDYKGEDLVEV